MTYPRQWHKRVPPDMLDEYLAKGWVIYRWESNAVLIVWPDAEGETPRDSRNGLHADHQAMMRRITGERE